MISIILSCSLQVILFIILEEISCWYFGSFVQRFPRSPRHFESGEDTGDEVEKVVSVTALNNANSYVTEPRKSVRDVSFKLKFHPSMDETKNWRISTWPSENANNILNRSSQIWFTIIYLICHSITFTGTYELTIDPAPSVWLHCSIDHFTVVFSVSWPLSGSEAEVDLVMIQTLEIFRCKFS